MDRLPPLTAIRAFEAAGRHENFSRAAEELGMTQAAISYQIRQLEDRVGRALFVRGKGRVRLSEAGLRLLPAISAAFGGMAEAFAAIREEDHEVLSITSLTSIGGAWLGARIGRFQLRHPDIAVRLSLSNDVIDLSASSFDVAIRAGKGNWPGMRSEFLFRQHLAPMCSPAFLEMHAIRRPEDLLRVERLTPDDPWWSAWFEAAGVDAPPLQRGGMYMDNQLPEASVVMSGFGVALMSPLFWRAEMASGRLVQPFETLYMPGNSHWLVHPDGRVGLRKIERLREWLREEVAADKGSLPAEVWEPF
ncbi:LysR substrate-binding domain-containing protein [Novosphingobium aerophilum]|uniref:LysR substrate-binding domain-containing protein n=1 Tax=Novosphingobium TaxID=165696 RepID=UPI0012C0618A|nr:MULTISPECIES: LysR substrate-binding domain-containing protein [unclassified Novosphingobium]MPS66976.1 LysR family transcriptional regulator [Novosphingobium sp.]WRT94212.1 LysR substrate-binding domain-containing protein [Novosphingobium sp. RL4]